MTIIIPEINCNNWMNIQVNYDAILGWTWTTVGANSSISITEEKAFMMIAILKRINEHDPKGELP
jgi:hypothetical protein